MTSDSTDGNCAPHCGHVSFVVSVVGGDDVTTLLQDTFGIEADFFFFFFSPQR